MLDFKPAFGFCSDYSLHYLLKVGICLVLLLHFNFDGRFENLLEIANHYGLIRSLDSTKFHKDRLEVMKMRSIVSSFF